ncbi:hypothetical protein ACHAXA_009279 [Cyclostephanos tholiformis]|jgi:riboflavin synthase|uniref:Lumazine-binding domain-containing protein n=1 Tax=Cyclostephanos tholiformis TaxID=382380 RepID=A0ABD3RE91_9STRA
MTSPFLVVVAIATSAASLFPTGRGFVPYAPMPSRAVAVDVVDVGGVLGRRSTSPTRTTSTTSSTATTSTKRWMFTGIIEEVGEIVSYETRDDMVLWDGSIGSGTEMVIRGKVVMDGAYPGCSICVNGACLTATELDYNDMTFRVGLAPETLRRTDLGSYVVPPPPPQLLGGEGGGEGGNIQHPSTTTTAATRTRRMVNLERASEIGGRNSGHFVQGHVDGVGTIVDRWTDGNSLFYRVSLPSEHMRYVVPKGFVAVDGASLTVCDVGSGSGTGYGNDVGGTVQVSSSGNTTTEDEGRGWFTFMLVEYTQKNIIIPEKVVGDTVNVEVDVLGKYSERAWGSFVPRMAELESKVRELEDKVTRLEGIGGGGGVGDGRSNGDATVVAGAVASGGDRNEYGDVVPAPFAAAAAAAAAGERWVRADQEYSRGDGTDLNPTRENRNGMGTEWVRTRQAFYDTNY